MTLLDYFETDDGSLPEIEVRFSEPGHTVRAFTRLFTLGAINHSANGPTLWLRASQSEAPFTGPGDAALVISGDAESIQILLNGITCAGCRLPDLGVFVGLNELILDYRMGPEWGGPQIDGLIALLRDLQTLGGEVSVHQWWGDDGQRVFEEALALVEVSNEHFR
ncbi:hypothetical protein [Pinirhizobacter soli]|uniref:hypothetical protein n=1 Tax=Pinirhizobacter soli TaxID=2786953 RepID=UPI00202A122A|nr:hypothetical protein [Pinirhizobacter soli]